MNQAGVGPSTRPERRASLRWVLGHLPLTAAVAAMGAAMGAAMVSLVEGAHDGRTPAATAWVLCVGTAVVLGATMLVAASLPAWQQKRGLYQPLARACAAVACLVLGAARPAPLILGLALAALLGIPWMLAVARRLAYEDTSHPAPDAPHSAPDAQEVDFGIGRVRGIAVLSGQFALQGSTEAGGDPSRTQP